MTIAEPRLFTAGLRNPAHPRARQSSGITPDDQPGETPSKSSWHKFSSTPTTPSHPYNNTANLEGFFLGLTTPGLGWSEIVLDTPEPSPRRTINAFPEGLAYLKPAKKLCSQLRAFKGFDCARDRILVRRTSRYGRSGIWKVTVASPSNFE